MKSLIKKALFFTLVLCFSLVVGVGVGMAEDGEDPTREERIESLIERIEELSTLVEEMKTTGDLDVVREKIKEDEGKLEECYPYLRDYITYGVDNNPEQVEKLQLFLNQHMGTDLEVDGHYGTETKAVVNDFQVKYTEEVLAPWGITEPTGQVYMTTKAKINDIMCPTVVVPVPEVRTEKVATEEEEVVVEEEEEEMEEDVVVDVIDEEETEELEDDETTTPAGAASLLDVGGDVNYLPIIIIVVGLIGFAGALYYVYAPKKKRGKVIS